MAYPTSDLLAARHASARATMAASGLDAFIVVHPPNVRYLTGFTGSTAIVVLTPAEAVFRGFAWSRSTRTTTRRSPESSAKAGPASWGSKRPTCR
jgi:Xaa-Pro aminopeptidase